jgi:hypothetical protein
VKLGGRDGVWLLLVWPGILCGAGDGDPALLRPRREALLFWRLRLRLPRAGWVGLTGAGDEIPVRDAVVTEPALAVKLRLLAFDDVRWCIGAR